MNKIPQELYHLFWDTDIESFDPTEYPRYTIERILEIGDEDAATWMKDTFSELQIKEVIRSERRLTPKSAQFWATIYSLPFEEVAALKT